MARKQKAALADLRALEEQSERANPIAPSTKRKQVTGGRRTKKTPSLAVLEKKEKPSLHNAMEDEMAMMPSGEYDGAGKHTLMDHLAAPMKGFGDYLHAFETAGKEAPAPAKAKKILPGATRKGGMKTGKYEGEGMTGGVITAARRAVLLTRLGPRAASISQGADAGPTIHAIRNALGYTDEERRFLIQVLHEEFPDNAAITAAFHDMVGSVAAAAPAAASAAAPASDSKEEERELAPKSRRKTGKGATPSMGLSQFRGGMAMGQMVGSGKKAAKAKEPETMSEASEEDMAEAVGGAKPARKKRAPAGPSDGRRKRAEIVRKVMAEKGLSMIEASKYVKQHGLY